MAITLNDIQIKMSLTLDQSVTPPTPEGSEWQLRTSFINRSYEEWANAYDWEALRSNTWVTVTGVSQASITLPASFKKMASFPLYHSSGVAGGEQWPEIQPHETKLYDTSDKYFYVLGYRGAQTMVWNPGTMSSGASLYLEFYTYPTSLASPADVPLTPDPEFLVERSMAYILEARSDSRFQEIEAKARSLLLNMISNEDYRGRAYNNKIFTPERLQGFRLGRDG